MPIISDTLAIVAPVSQAPTYSVRWIGPDVTHDNDSVVVDIKQNGTRVIKISFDTDMCDCPNCSGTDDLFVTVLSPAMSPGIAVYRMENMTPGKAVAIRPLVRLGTGGVFVVTFHGAPIIEATWTDSNVWILTPCTHPSGATAECDVSFYDSDSSCDDAE